MIRITIINGDGKIELSGDTGETLYEVLAGSGIDFDAPCGGMGLCGKCKVQIIDPEPDLPSTEELEQISADELNDRYRLACRYNIKGDTVIRLPVHGLAAAASEEGDTHKDIRTQNGNIGNHSSVKNFIKGDIGSPLSGSYDNQPFILETTVSPGTPGLSDQRSLLRRITDSIREVGAGRAGSDIVVTFNEPAGNELADNGTHEYIVNKHVVGQLSDIAGSAPGTGWPASLRVVHTDNMILDIKPVEQASAGAGTGAYGVAIDIGTTTVAAYLVRFADSMVVDSASALNTQKVFGADVISRIAYTQDNKDGLEILRLRIISQINNLVNRLTFRNKIATNDIFCVSIAGNTTMLHLLLGANPAMIAAAPFIPVFTGSMILNASEIGLEISHSCLAVILPSISAYVGADITAGILSCGMADSNSVNLLIDIGTNGEIVLGNKDRIICCSTAAGPAFEGAGIRNGLGGVKGAIDSVTYNSSALHYTTISGTPPAGICGSGIIDTVAILLKNGIIDPSGSFNSLADYSGNQALIQPSIRLPVNLIQNPTQPSGQSPAIPDALSDALSSRLAIIDGLKSFVLARRSDSVPIALTQKDIREVQLAKAAIAAGIRILIRKMEIDPSSIENVYLAGGFGNYINKDSAVSIGLIPESLSGKIVPVGNAAGKGAVLALTERYTLQKAAKVVETAEYIELSASAEFQDEYVDCMFFGTI